MNRRVFLGMIAGATVMFGFGILWLLIGLVAAPPTKWLWLSFLVGIGLGASIATLGLGVSRLPHDPVSPTAEQVATGRAIGRRFGLIFGIEFAAIFLAVVALNLTHLPDYIPCAIALIVGIHFFPLAPLFKAPVYYVTGLLGCAIALAGCFVADAVLRQKFVGLSFGLLLWATAAWVTWIGFSLVNRVANHQPQT